MAEIRRVLATEVAAVRARVAPGEPFGLGLRLGDAASRELTAPAVREAFAAELTAADLFVFTVNGFPYGDFAAERVKANAYRPDWRHEERHRYTLRVAEALAALPGPVDRTVSTVAGGFKPEAGDSGARAAMAHRLEATARDLALLADRTGIAVRLCLEPEPFTTLETTAEVVSFFTEHLFPYGAHVRAHLGLCYDCCHQAVQYEDPVASLRALHEAGIAVGKLQVSSAPTVPTPARAEARAALLAFDERRYLHQVVARMPDGTLRRALDLPDVRAAEAEWAGAESWRCHFHVPIGWAGGDELGTTRADWQAAVRYARAAGLTDHYEVETYTWGVLPADTRQAQLAAAGGSLAGAMAEELRALLAVLEAV